MRRLALLARGVVLFAAACPALAAEAPSAPGGAPEIVEAWARATPAGRPAALYMTVRGGAQDDRILRIETNAAPQASLHRSFEEGGVMRMRPVESLDVPSGQTVTMAPGGYHVMLEGTPKGLVAGDRFAFKAVFERYGEIAAQAEVRKNAGPGGSMDGMQMPMERPARR